MWVAQRLYTLSKMNNDIYSENSQGYCLMRGAKVFSPQSDNDQIEIRAFLSETLRTAPSFHHPQ